MSKSDSSAKGTGMSSIKGQIEIFGLAFIVILISIGFFIYVSFKAQQEPTNLQKDFTDDKTANDFILAILNVNIKECPEFTVNDLIIDCARDHRITCGGRTSCVALNSSVNTILNKTFMERSTKFGFYSENLKYSGNLELFNVSYLNCTPTSEQGKRGIAIIRLYPAPGNVYLNMSICH